jgi:hypothetical protein
MLQLHCGNFADTWHDEELNPSLLLLQEKFFIFILAFFFFSIFEFRQKKGQKIISQHFLIRFTFELVLSQLRSLGRRPTGTKRN